MKKVDFKKRAYQLLERLEKSIVERQADKSNDQLFTEKEAFMVETWFKAFYADGMSYVIKKTKGEIKNE